MANKGSSGHMKRLDAPKYFHIHRKENKYVVKQNPGRHTLDKSVALSLAIGKLGMASTRFESDKIIRSGLVKVNGKMVKEPKFPVGLNDMLAVGDEGHMIGIDERGHIKIEKGSNSQIFRVIGKYKAKKGSMMLRLHDGSIVNGADDVNLYDSVVLSGRKVERTLKMGPGSKCEVIDGVHVGTHGVVKEINSGNMHRQKSVIVEPDKGGGFETLVKNIIIVE
ncbi:MAG: S4 domain-containing protein [Candidatus Micrarchaeaceae archaeon]